MKKQRKMVIKMKPITKVLITIIFIVVGLFIYHYTGIWGEERTQLSITLCIISWTYLFFVQTIFIHFIWEK